MTNSPSTLPLVRETYGREHRQVDVTLKPDGGLHVSGLDYGPKAEALTGSDGFEFHYSVSASEMPEFIELTGIDADDLLTSLVANWSDRFGDLEAILTNELGVQKFLI